MDAVGISSPRAAGSSAILDAGAFTPSPIAADFRKQMSNVLARQLSRGHGERFDAVVWVNDVALGAWDAGAPMPDGAVLVEEALEMAVKGDRPQGVLFMEKKDGAWTFGAADADGGAVTDRRCEQCHAEAPRDDVFRVNQSIQAAMTATTTATVPTAVASAAATYDARSAGRADASVSP
jgi:hypothetical protein